MNVDPLNEFSDTDIWNALNDVQLKSYFSTLDKGLYSLISENGGNLRYVLLPVR